MVAAFASIPSTISGISHLKFKESDRLHAIRDSIGALGGKVSFRGDDDIIIHPAPLHGGVIDPAGDHRTAMSGAVLGLGVGDVVIRDAECVNKSFPGFWEALSEAGLL
jgi:3-phosphoshikimate 1-carboxyvinyltransferase